MSSIPTTSTCTKPKSANGLVFACLNNNKDRLINRTTNYVANEGVDEQQYFVRFENAIKLPSLTTRNSKTSNESKGFSKLDSYFKKLEQQKANNQVDVNNNNRKNDANKKPPKSLLGMFLEDTSSKKHIEEDTTNFHSRFCKMNIVEEMRMFPYINEEEHINSDKYFNFLMDYLSKFNSHYLLNRSVWQLETKNKLISFLESLIEKYRSISDSLAVSKEHNAAIAFNVWKLNDLVEDMKKNTKTTTKNNSTKEKPISISTNTRAELNENMVTAPSESLNLFDESMNSFEDKELLNNIMNEINDTSNLILTTIPMNTSETIPAKLTNINLQIRPDNIMEQTTANLNQTEDKHKILNTIEKVAPIQSNSVNIEHLFQRDPRYECFLNNFASLIVDVIQKLSDLNLEYVNYLLDRQKGSVPTDCFDSFYQKRFRLVLENKKKQYQKDVEDNVDFKDRIYMKNLKIFLRRKFLSFLAANRTNKDEHINPIDMFMAIRSEFEKVKESIKYNQHYVKMKLFQAKFSYTLIQFKLFMHEIFTEHLLLNYKTFELDESLVDKITSIVRPISTMIPLEAHEVLKDPRKKSNKLDVDLVDLKFSCELFKTTETSSTEVSQYLNKNYKYCVYLNEVHWNEFEKFAANEPLLIDEDLEKLESFSKTNQTDGLIAVKNGPLKIPLDENELSTQCNDPTSIEKTNEEKTNTNAYQEMLSSTPVFEKLTFLKEVLESNEKRDKADFNLLLDQENETFNSNIILETPRYQPNTSGLTAKSSTSSFENDLIFSQREIEAFDSNIIPKTPIYKPNSSISTSKSSSMYENDLLTIDILDKTLSRKGSMNFNDSDDDINATLSSLVERVIDNIERPEIEDVSLSLNESNTTIVTQNEEEYKNIIEVLKQNLTSSIQQESSLITNDKNNTIEETIKTAALNDNNDLKSNTGNKNVIETGRVLRQRKRTRSMTRNENNNNNNNTSRSTSPVELRHSSRRQSRISLPVVAPSNQKHLYKYSSLSNSNYDTRTPKDSKRTKKSLDIICQNIIRNSNEPNKLKLSNSKSKLIDSYSTRCKDKLLQTNSNMNININQVLADEQSLQSCSENFPFFTASQPLPILSNEHLQQFLTESDLHLQQFNEK